MHDSDQLILMALGYPIQYLRGLKWFNDGWTWITAILVSFVMVMLNHDPPPATDLVKFVREIALSVAAHVPAVLGGVLSGHMAAQIPIAATLAGKVTPPTFNSYGEDK